MYVGGGGALVMVVVVGGATEVRWTELRGVNHSAWLSGSKGAQEIKKKGLAEQLTLSEGIIALLISQLTLNLDCRGSLNATRRCALIERAINLPPVPMFYDATSLGSVDVKRWPRKSKSLNFTTQAGKVGPKCSFVRGEEFHLIFLMCQTDFFFLFFLLNGKNIHVTCNEE